MIMMRSLLVAAASAALAFSAQAQGLDVEKLRQMLERDGQITLKLSGVTVLKYDYPADSGRMEALAFRPAAEGRYPALLLIPGYSRTAWDYVPLGIRLAKEGLACVAITQPGWGGSTGRPDFVGPRTIRALELGFRRFLAEAYVDSSRAGVFGYSRGAMAASLLAVRMKGLKAAILAGGVYDLKRAYQEIQDEGIRKDIEQEAGLTDEAFRERSSIFEMSNLSCPVLILHGEKDRNAPVSQAHLLQEKLEALKKDYEIKLFPDRDHDLGMDNLLESALPFLRARLGLPARAAR